MTSAMYLIIIGAFVLIDWYFIEIENNALNKPVMWGIRTLLHYLLQALISISN